MNPIMSDITIKLAGDPQKLEQMANAIRFLAIDAVEKAQSGHPGMPMGMADIATVLFSQFLKFDPTDPEWPDRDRFVLSNGHGSMLLYALNYLTGYAGMTLEQLKNFRQLGSHTAGHPEKNHSLGIETTTGPLGQGLANAVGMALAERMLNAEFGSSAFDHHTYAFAGDGCLMEGISQEAISLAGHLQLGRLIVFFDDNHITIDGSTDLSTSEDQEKRFQASGWNTQSIDGHNYQAIAEAIIKAQNDPRPSMIACRTTIAFGAPHKGGTAGAHGAPLGESEIAATRAALDWPYPAFEIPDPIQNDWKAVGHKGAEVRKAWQQRIAAMDMDKREELQRRFAENLPKNWRTAMQDLIKNFVKNTERQATRQLSQTVLETLTSSIPEMVGGSADLTGSNNTRAKDMDVVNRNDFSGRYIHYGIREHAMAAIMNGLRLHGGFMPYGGTFLTFSDYCRPAIRLAALMQIQSIFVMTHDSIGLGEDGPTHQPVEHLASLRAMPGLYVFRPADGVEVAECWMLAVEKTNAPSLIALTRQKIPPLRTSHSQENLCAEGAYLLRATSSTPKVTLLATGSEVHLAIEAQAILESEGVATTVVSMPCWRLFEEQPEDYRQSILRPESLIVAIEAGSPLGWDRYVGDDGIVLGMDNFGISAPASDVFAGFGFTTGHIVDIVMGKLQRTG